MAIICLLYDITSYLRYTVSPLLSINHKISYNNINIPINPYMRTLYIILHNVESAFEYPCTDQKCTKLDDERVYCVPI